MMDCMSAIVLLLIATVLACYILSEKRKNLPPGPRGYPIIGNVLDFVGGDLRDVFEEYRRIYGDVFTIRVFNKVFIICNGYKMITNVFLKQGDTFSERPEMQIATMATPGNGFWSPKNQQWKINKKFCVSTLKDFGMGKNVMQIKIHDEIKFLLNFIDQQNGKPFDICRILQSAVANVIFSVLFGNRRSYEDPVFHEIIQKIHENATTPFLFALPFFRFIPGDPMNIRRYFNNQKFLTQYYKGVVEEHMTNFTEGTPENLIDAYISKMSHVSPDTEDATINRSELVTIIDNLCSAGTDTSTVSLQWGLLYLLHDSAIQHRLRSEINKVVSPGKLPTMEDKVKLPYTEATISEILRRSCIAPFAIPHAAARDSNIDGYQIPESASIMPNIHSCLMDTNLWKDPKMFRPTRFLNADGTVKRIQDLIPFSVGKRSCLGEPLARMEIFLIYSAMLQRFEFRPATEGELPPLDDVMGIAVAPKEFHVRAIPVKI